MPDYLLSGTNAKGLRVVERVNAATAEEALAIIRDRGYTDVELHTDDITAAAQVADEARDDIRKHVSPEMELNSRQRSDTGAMLFTIGNTYRKNWVFILLALGVLIWRRSQGLAWHWIDYAALLMLAVPPILTLLMPRHYRTYTRIQEAAVGARWHEVLRLAARLERHGAKLGAGVRIDLIFWRAKAVAALGRLEEGLALVAAAPECSQLSQGTYLAQLATVHDAANDNDGALDCFRKATEVSPDEPAGWLGLAELLAVRFERTQEARHTLDRLLEFPLSAETRSGVQFIQGAIALSEGRLATARENLEAFRADMVKRARVVPLALGHVRLSEALLAIAHARNGARETALSYYKAAAPFLRLHKVAYLLRRCEAALPEATAN